jgi:Domain of unknown function (DUF4190)
MKQCLRCQRTYNDDDLNFCLEDGELLVAYPVEPQLSRPPQPTPFADDAPPTIMFDRTRVTNPTNWPDPPQQSSPPAPWEQQNVINTPFGRPAFVHSADQTLPTIALILGILSIPLLCCYGGIWLGLPAAVLGFIGMRNADSDRSRYGGRGMAIAGLVLGIITFVISLIIAFIAILAR